MCDIRILNLWFLSEIFAIFTSCILMLAGKRLNTRFFYCSLCKILSSTVSFQIAAHCCSQENSFKLLLYCVIPNLLNLCDKIYFDTITILIKIFLIWNWYFFYIWLKAVMIWAKFTFQCPSKKGLFGKKKTLERFTVAFIW